MMFKTYCVGFFSVLCLVYPMLPVFLDCPFFEFSNVYLSFFYSLYKILIGYSIVWCPQQCSFHWSCTYKLITHVNEYLTLIKNRFTGIIIRRSRLECCRLYFRSIHCRIKPETIKLSILLFPNAVLYNYWLWNRLLSGFINLKKCNIHRAAGEVNIRF